MLRPYASSSMQVADIVGIHLQRLHVGHVERLLSVRPRFNHTELPAKKGGQPKTISRPQIQSAPRSPVNRNSGLHPLLGTDDIKYVLGPGAWTKTEEERQNHSERHEAFIALIERVAQETDDKALNACKRFYAQPAEVEKARTALASAAPGSNVALYVGGLLTERPALQAWWRKAYEAAASASLSGAIAECLISGIVGPVAPTHPKIKHAASLGGQPAGVSLMSFDKGAFKSYGWEQCANSPVSPDRAMAYVLALNELLKPGGKHRKDINGVAYVFWLRRENTAENYDPFEAVLQAKPEQVKELLEFKQSSDPDPNNFYMAVLTANGSRLVLRSWVTETLPAVKANLRDWFLGLRIQPRFADQELRLPSIGHLVEVLNKPEKSPDRGQKGEKKDIALEKKKDAKKKRSDPCGIALVLRALRGHQSPLGYPILQRLVRRMLIDKIARTDPAAAGLLRLCLNDMTLLDPDGEVMTEDCNESSRNAAYVCGRLLAIHEGLQRTAFVTGGEKPPRVTVTDRFYSLACVSPALAMPRVFELGIKHLSKLRRIKGKDGLAASIRNNIAQLRKLIEGDEFPGTLSLKDKGRFALGYYHEIAWPPKAAANSDLNAADTNEQLGQIDEEEEED